MKGRVCRLALAAIGLGALLTLNGCGNFFVDTTTGTGSGGSTGNTSDYVYVANQTTNTLTGYTIASGALTAVSGSPYGLLNGLAAASVEVSRANTFVYVGGAGAIECFSIGTGGALTLVNSAAATGSARFASLTTSYDGKWLLALDSITQTLYTYGINTSNGTLTAVAQVAYSAAANVGAVVPTMVRISPNGAAVVAALGTGGDVIFSFNTSTGVPAFVGTLAINAGFSDNAVAIDANSAYVYIARGASTTGASGVVPYSLSTSNILTPVQGLVASGSAPFAVLLDSTGAYAYTANRGDGTLSGYSVASAGTLTALGSSPYAAGTLTTALARDNSGKYVVAASFGGGPDLTLYSFDSTTAGKLDTVTTAVSGNDPAGSIALATTH